MAEAVAFSLASKVLSTIASPAFTAAYKEGLSILEAEDELSKLQVTIETIQAVLLDAEKKHQSSDAIRNWIKRLKGILYDASDLFDEVATRDLLKQQIQKGSHNRISKKVLVFSKLNPIISRYSIAKEVKEIRESLVEISTDMAQFGFMTCQNEVPMHGTRVGQDPGCFVDAKLVVGREDDKNAVLEMLFNESNSVAPAPHVIAIVGIGGMGKTTLAQLIYNDEEVQKKFANRWFACISDISDEREVLGKFLNSIRGGDHSRSSVSELKTGIMNSVKDKKFLLVLDDVWDDHRGRWLDRTSLLSSCAKGSKIIVTTRLLSVARAVNASTTHNLEGLSEKDAWCLFKILAFAPGDENDPRLISSGKKILKICRGVPLAIHSMGNLLYERNTVSEWEEVERQGHLKNIGDTISVIKLSYDHLPSNLKDCFAYCSLFPKDYRFMKHELICLWISQGYIELGNEETAFMYLLRRGFFQEAEKVKSGEVLSYKMHDIIHDLASYVAGEESIVLNGTTSMNSSSFTLHVSVTDCEWDVEQLKVKRLRSIFLMRAYFVHSPRTLDKLCNKFKMLRTLSLKGMFFKEMLPASIGELKQLRYLDLSFNLFEELPDSITNLVNLVSLNLMGCFCLIALPSELRNLIKLRYLNIEECGGLDLTGIVELSCLQYLNFGEFVVRRVSELGALASLQQQFRGDLLISDMKDEYISNWKLPVHVQKLVIERYLGARLPDWSTIDGTNNYLAHLSLEGCHQVKHLPHLQCFPNLRSLQLEHLSGLEFVEVEEDYLTSSSPYLPRLEKLTLYRLSSLKRWRNKTIQRPLAFPLLSELDIQKCNLLELALFPRCPRLIKFVLGYETIGKGAMQRELWSTHFCPSVSPPPLQNVHIYNCNWPSSLLVEATASLRSLKIDNCSGLKSLQLASPHLRRVQIENCDGIVSLEVSATSYLRKLEIRGCKKFKNLIIGAPLNALESLVIKECPEFGVSLLGDDRSGMQSQLPLTLCNWLSSLQVEATASLRWLEISHCSSLKSLHLASPHLQEVNISSCEGLVSLEVVDAPSLWRLEIGRCGGLKSLHLESPELQRVDIYYCDGLMSLEAVATPSLRELSIRHCNEFKNLIIDAPLNALHKLLIKDCPEFDIMELELDWDSMVKLYTLQLNPMPPWKNIPLSLRNRQALGKLQITHITDSQISSSQ